MSNTSTFIELEGVVNSRDLGGMKTRDGAVVRSGRLIRSGHLANAAPSAVDRLSGLIDTVVDFRTVMEREQNPDAVIPGVISHHMSILEGRIMTPNKKNDVPDERPKRRLMTDRSEVAGNFANMYRGFIANEHSRAQYAKFFRILLEDHDRAVLWHCSAGKDRAGTASILVETVLGMDRDSITEDYLLTNSFNKEENAGIRERMRIENGGELSDEIWNAMIMLFIADESYINALYDEAAKQFGSLEGYITKGLGITPAEQERLRAMYLE